MLDLKRLKRFLSKAYRDEYLDTTVRSGIAYQIFALRSKAKMTQSVFSAQISKPQSVVSRLENAEYGKVTIQTLLDIAKGLDVALLVRFVDYPTFFGFANAMSEADLAVDNVQESVQKNGTQLSPEWSSRLSKALSPHDQNDIKRQGGIPSVMSLAPYVLQNSKELEPQNAFNQYR